MKSEQSKVNKGNDLADRLLKFAVAVIKIVHNLPTNPVGRHIGGQILRAGTSPGANYEESRGAESRSDFIHKLGIVLKELKETRFWLRVLINADILAPQRIEPVLNECEELCAIVAKSVVTAKKNK
jgi:four helix bundle protein